MRDLVAARGRRACKAGALLIVVVTEAVSFGALKSPGAMGADIVVAEGQSIGNGLNFGGPYLGLFATREKFLRQMPGRPLRRDGGRERPARLRADAFHPRAAYPPREGHQQHLHELRPVRAGVHHPSDAAGRGGPAQAGAREPRQRRGAGGRARRACPASRWSRRSSSTSSPSGRPSPARTSSTRWRMRGVIGGVPARGCSRMHRSCRTASSSPPPKP